mmetsp:Transcript_50261/g.86073  ORF Transcript_50261/g.86073 Transcript_50261/m.86073 type:complete len:207 (+) Transcript_50261:665-1285(+)
MTPCTDAERAAAASTLTSGLCLVEGKRVEEVTEDGKRPSLLGGGDAWDTDEDGTNAAVVASGAQRGAFQKQPLRTSPRGANSVKSTSTPPAPPTNEDMETPLPSSPSSLLPSSSSSSSSLPASPSPTLPSLCLRFDGSHSSGKAPSTSTSIITRPPLRCPPPPLPLLGMSPPPPNRKVGATVCVWARGCRRRAARTVTFTALLVRC